MRWAVIDAGALTLDTAGSPCLSVSAAPKVLRRIGGCEVEALDRVPTTHSALVGTDDEGNGGVLTVLGRLCR